VDYKELFKEVMPAPGDFEECFAFSIHKAGSTLMNSMIGAVCKAEGIPALSIPDRLFREGVSASEWDHDPALLDLVEPGRIYYGFRHLPRVLLDPKVKLREKRSVLLVRDPRDALVSEYFSYGGKHVSHRMPDKGKEAFLKRINATAELDIDAYVLRRSTIHLNKLKAYRNNLDFANVLLRRYEDVYFDKRQFLADIFAHFGQTVSAPVLDQVAQKYDIRPASEEVGKHIRKGEPGDHREKLQPETIAKLNGIFADISRSFGYELAD
jgi:hypothetical protein